MVRRYCSQTCAAHHSRARPLADRFWSKVDKNGPTQPHMTTPCWVWTAYRDRDGYGKFGLSGPRRVVKASRVAWEIEIGPILVGLMALHRCDNPPCVRADHLFLGTCADNLRDMADKGRSDAQAHPEKYAAYLERARAVIQAKAAARPDPDCIHCKGPARRRWRGRCATCNAYFVRHGADRPACLLAAFAAHDRARDRLEGMVASREQETARSTT
jgi:hypothetical protein